METKSQVIDLYVGQEWFSARNILEAAGISCHAFSDTGEWALTKGATVRVSSNNFSSYELARVTSSFHLVKNYFSWNISE